MAISSIGYGKKLALYEQTFNTFNRDILTKGLKTVLSKDDISSSGVISSRITICKTRKSTNLKFKCI